MKEPHFLRLFLQVFSTNFAKSLEKRFIIYYNISIEKRFLIKF